MFTLLSKILNFISAYILLYVILIVRFFIIGEISERPSMIVLYLLLGLILLGLLWIALLLSWSNNIRIKGEVQEQNLIQESGILSAFNILPFLSIVNQTTLLIGLLLLVLLGSFSIRSSNYFFNPLFYLLGYKQYKFDNKKVFSKKTRDELRIFLNENRNGLPTRELVENTYINFAK